MSGLAKFDYGLVFPQRINSKGFFDYSGDLVKLVQSSILNIWTTPKGSRRMVPEFGTLLHTLQFEPFDDVSIALAYRWSIEAVEKWEPRVLLNDMTAGINLEQGRLEIRGSYSIRNTDIELSAAVGIVRR